jgi:hypothetical protein
MNQGENAEMQNKAFLLPLVDNVEMNIYMSFSNKPNSVKRLEMRQRAYLWIIT